MELFKVEHVHGLLAQSFGFSLHLRLQVKHLLIARDLQPFHIIRQLLLQRLLLTLHELRHFNSLNCQRVSQICHTPLKFFSFCKIGSLFRRT